MIMLGPADGARCAGRARSARPRCRERHVWSAAMDPSLHRQCRQRAVRGVGTLRVLPRALRARRPRSGHHQAKTQHKYMMGQSNHRWIQAGRSEGVLHCIGSVAPTWCEVAGSCGVFVGRR